VNSLEITEEMLDEMTDLFDAAINAVKSESTKVDMNNSVEKLRLMKMKEDEELKKEQAEATIPSELFNY
jgi:hypothetical protein